MGAQWRYLLLFIWFSYLLVSGVLLFTRGFLLNREVQPQRSSCRLVSDTNNCDNETHRPFVDSSSQECDRSDPTSGCFKDGNFLTQAESEHEGLSVCSPSKTRVVLIVVDALKYDFTDYNEQLEEHESYAYQNKLTVINELLISKPHNSRLFKFVADPPTTTMQRLKGLTTGSLPTFIDIGSNFATPEINEDNIIDQLIVQNKSIVFMGDDTWSGLYPRRFIREYSYPSFNVWDLDTVDNGIKNHLLPEIQKDDWSVLIAHFLGVDHCGHRYGPFHPEMSRKLKEMDKVIRDVVSKIDNNTVLFVIGDHGMTDSGGHGGDSEDEVTAAMFVYSLQPLMHPHESLCADTVSQVDIIPTLSTILGTPVPFANLGSVILEALPSTNDSNEDIHSSLNTIWNNVEQITTYIRQYSQSTNQFSQEKLSGIYFEYSTLKERVSRLSSVSDIVNFARNAKLYLQHVRQMCEEVWVKFDPFSMSRGLLLMIFSIFLSFMVVDGMPGDKLRRILEGTFLLMGYGWLIAAAVGTLMFHAVGLVDSVELSTYFATGIASVLVIGTVIVRKWESVAMHWHSHSKTEDWASTVGRVLVTLSVCTMFSNSFVVEEASVLLYFLLTMGWILAYTYKSPKQETSLRGRADKNSPHWFKMYLSPVKYKLVIMVLLFSIVVRLSRYYWTCREESVPCVSFVTPKPNYLTSQTGHEYHNVECLFTLVIQALFVTVVRIWLRSCGNLVGFSPSVTLARYAPTIVVVCTGGFWVLQGLPLDTKNKLFLPWQLQVLPWIIYAIITTAFVCLTLQPLCVFVMRNKSENISVPVYGQENVIPHLFNQMKEMMHARNKAPSGDSSPVVYGLATVYSAVFVLVAVFVCLLTSLLLGDTLAPSAVLMCVSATLLLAILSVIRLETAILTAQLFHVPWSAVVSWGFLAAYFFYGTGHQAAFPSIQWGAAMVGTGGQLGNHLLPGLLLLINTFAAHALLGLTLPLLIVAPCTLRVMFPRLASSRGSELRHGELLLLEREELLQHSVFTLCSRYVLFHAVRVFACMLAATIHCRHLMVWKIFAPKLIFEILGFFVTIPCVLVGYLLTIRITKKVEELINSLEQQNRVQNEKAARYREQNIII